MSRYNIFNTPHKTWRRALGDLCAKAKSTDYADLQQVQNTTQFAYCVLSAYRVHTHSENTVLAPALKNPDVGGHWQDVHGMHELGAKAIKEDLIQLEKSAQNASKRVQLGERLNMHLEQFSAEDYGHTSLEESTVFMWLGRMYNDQELFELDVKATTCWNSMSEPEKEVIFPYFIRAHKGDDHPRILKIFKQILNANPEAWQKFVEMAKKEMTPSQVTKYENMKLFE